MRPWLPTYSSLGKQAAAAGRGAAAAGGAGGGGEYCYIEVQPIPKWRTVLKVAAGRMLAAHSARSSQPGNTHADGDGGGGSFSAASSEMLRSLEEMMLDDEQQSGGSSDGGGEGPATRAAPAAVRFRPVATRRAKNRECGGACGGGDGGGGGGAGHCFQGMKCNSRSAGACWAS